MLNESKGVKTSEFLVTLLGVIGGVIASLQGLEFKSLAVVMGSITTIACFYIYARMRTKLGSE